MLNTSCSDSLRSMLRHILLRLIHNLGSTENPGSFAFSAHWHKAGGASPWGVARAACFEELAGVFASSGAI